MKDKSLKSEIRNRFIEAVNEILKQREMNISQLMEALADYQQNWAQFQNGKRWPTIENISLLSSDFGYNANWLLTGEPPKMKKPGKSAMEKLEAIEDEIAVLKKKLK